MAPARIASNGISAAALPTGPRRRWQARTRRAILDQLTELAHGLYKKYRRGYRHRYRFVDPIAVIITSRYRSKGDTGMLAVRIFPPLPLGIVLFGFAAGLTDHLSKWIEYVNTTAFSRTYFPPRRASNDRV